MLTLLSARGVAERARISMRAVRRSALSVLLVLAAAGCGPVVPAPVPAPKPSALPPPKPPSPAQPQATMTAEPTVAARPFALAWSKLTKPFNKALAIAPSGHVGVLASRHLSLHDGRSGEVVGQADVCFTFEHALGFVDDKTAALVCEDGIKLFQLPDLSYRGVRPLDVRATGAGFVKGKLALSFETGPVKVLSTSDWTELVELPVDQRVTALAFAQDGAQLAVGLEQGEVLVYALSGGQGVRLNVKRGLPVAALSFAPDGKRLFAAAGPVSALLEVKSRTVVKRFRTVAGVRRALWLSAQELVTAGDDGLLLLRLDDGVAKSMSGAGGQPLSLAARATEQVVCEAQREGKVSCLSRGSIPASRQILTGSEPAGSRAEKTAARVVGLTGSRLQVKAHPRTTIPKPGVRAKLLRYTEQEVGPLRSARWLHMADVIVTRVKQDVIHLRLLGAVRTIAGVKEPLIYDTPVTLAWTMGE